MLDLGGSGKLFAFSAGVDDEVGTNHGSVMFKVLGDGRSLWQSAILHGGEPPVSAEVNLDGIRQLALVVENGGDGIDFDHADWADAKIVMLDGKPQALAPVREPAVVLTPKPDELPRIHGPKVYGARPGSSFLFAIPATGARPLG